MYEFFLYDVQTRHSSVRPSRLTVVFCPFPFATEDLFEALKSHLTNATPPDAIILLGTTNHQDMIASAILSRTLAEGLPAITRYVSTPPIIGALLDGEGRLSFPVESSAVGAFGQELTPEIRRQGLMHIFKSRNGVLESGGAFHYIKPSGKHCDKFVRTANVLIRGAEVYFIALWLISRFKDVRHIYTDTAAINTVGQALVSLASELTSSAIRCPVDSFSSYEGLKRFRFEDIDRSLFLISASTSGDLERLLADKHRVPRERIWTLFYLGPSAHELQLLCDLTRDDVRNPDGYEKIVSFGADACPLCKQGLHPIGIAGDQFLPESVKVSECLITTDDRPPWLNDFCSDFVGTGIIRTNCGTTTQVGRARELFVDMAAVYANDKRLQDGNDTGKWPNDFIRRLDRLINQCISYTTNRIVHVDDDGSQALALKVKKVLVQRGMEIKIISASELNSNLDSHISTDGTTLVVAGAVVTGRQLLAISQALRHIQSNRSVQYLIGLSRCPSARHFADIKRNLQFGDHGPVDYDLHCAREIWIPEDAAGRFQPWAEEREALVELREVMLGDMEGSDLVGARLAVLDACTPTHGLTRDLFLNSSASGEPLSLRPNFAFWRFAYNVSEISQSDVYFTISSILHFRRTATNSRVALASHEHHKVVLSPICFDRFNDGIIQASLLRAANRSELDYGSDLRLSRLMTDTMRFFVANSTNQAGEASSEFLLALFSGRLRLMNDDKRQFFQDLSQIANLKGMNKVLRIALLK